MKPHGNTQIKDHSFKHDIGVLVSSNSSFTFNKLGFCIIIKHQPYSDMNPKLSTYIVFSQNEQREWEIPCFVVNGYYTKVADNVISR